MGVGMQDVINGDMGQQKQETARVGMRDGWHGYMDKTEWGQKRNMQCEQEGEMGGDVERTVSCDWGWRREMS